MKNSKSINPKSYVVNFVVGDWSNDGHGKSNVYSIKSNLSKEQVYQAYIIGTKKLGFDFIKDVARMYQDSWLSDDQVKALDKAKIVIDDRSGEDHSLWPDSYFDIYLQIVQIGNPDFEHEKITRDWLDIGGYGLYD